MLNDFPIERPESCLSNLLLDRWLAEELTVNEARECEQHIAECASCRERYQELQRQASEFLERFAEPDLTRAENTSRSETEQKGGRVIEGRFGALGGRFFLTTSTAFAVAAAFFLYLERPAELPTSPSQSGDELEAQQRSLSQGRSSELIRTKGSARLSYSVKRGDALLSESERRSLSPGDQIRFRLNTARPRHFAILSKDGAGLVSVYFPESEVSELVQLLPGESLPFAIELDDSLGEEHIWGVFCDEAFALAPLEKALSLDGDLAPPSGCSLDEISWEKKLRP